MIKKIFFFFIILNFFNNSLASIKSEIIKNFTKIENLSFDFKQVIDEKTEIGKCKKKIDSFKWKFFGNKKSKWERIF